MFLTCAEVRALDRWAIDTIGIPAIVLMENAGRGMAELLQRLGIHGPVVICCGKGNNGGDGMVVARHLATFDIAVKVLLFADPATLSAEAKTNYGILERLDIPRRVLINPADIQTELNSADWIVDALFGTGLRGPIQEPLASLIKVINDVPAQVLAVDIPSGLDDDTGQPLGPTIRADHTAAVIAPRVGYAAPEAQPYLGQVHVIGLGVPGILKKIPTG